MATAELKSSLENFVKFTRSLKGDEKSEAQIFLDHFFRALGHDGVQEAGATLEFRIAKKPGSAQLELIKGDDAVKAKGGKKFADLLWPERVLIEMKSRKENLEKHYDQTFDYWTHIVPKRPPYVILCNFDEFWIYDFNTQLFDPVEKLLTRDLAASSAALAFLLPTAQKPIFGNNRVEVTRKAADTSEFDTQKVVDPTIVRRWRDRIEAAKSDKAALVAALDDLRRFQVLDPACGSGNFLFAAYRKMNRFERDLLVRLQRAKAKVELTSAVSIQQFHGLDNQPFAVELTKVTLMLAKELELCEADRLGASEGLFFQEKPLPLDNLDMPLPELSIIGNS